MAQRRGRWYDLWRLMEWAGYGACPQILSSFSRALKRKVKKMLRQKRDGDDVMQCITKACGYGSFICVYIYTCQNDQAWKWMFFPLHDQFSGTPTAWPWRFATWDNHVPPVFYPMTICFTCGSIPTTLHLNLFSAMIFLRFIWVHLRSFFHIFS